MTEPSLPEESLFLQALEIGSPKEQAAFLERACGTNVELRRSVEALLRHHREGSDFLESPPTEVVAAAEQLTAPECEPPTLDFLSPSAEPGSLGRLGQYEILEVVGRGGFGVVLKARDTKLDRIVAIKTLAQSLASSATARKRFVREAKAAAAVTHENVVDIHVVEDAGPVPYLVMECVSGISLEERLQQVGTLELDTILRIGMQIASGLAAAHKQGLVHRDVKPGNILLENGIERVKITDFGLARAAKDAAITQVGEVAGTPQYMSPEQALGRPVDQRSDLFSLGSVLYAMCAGRSPFRAESTVAALRRVCDDTPRPIREINPEIPESLVAIITRLLAKNPAERFQTAGEVAELLSRHLAEVQRPSAVGQVSNLPVDRGTGWKPVLHGRRWAVAAAVLLCLVVGLGLSEATGVTHVTDFVTTVLRIETPDGTLIVEVDDPQVQVTIEGDGGINITGAGPQQVRLRPGSYRLHATRDGKAIKNEVVTVTQGGKQVVKVSKETTEPSPARVPPQPWAILRGHQLNGWVRCLAFSRDGNTLTTGSGDQSVILWDADTGRVQARFYPHKGIGIAALALSPDDKTLATTAGSTLKLWDPSSLELRATIELPEKKYIGAMQFSPDAKTLATALSGGPVMLCDPATGQERSTLHVENHSPYCLAFSRDSKTLAVGNHDGSVTLWNLDSGQHRLSPIRHAGPIRCLAFSHNGKTLATGSEDGSLKLWSGDSLERVTEVGAHSEFILSLAFTPGSEMLVAAGGHIETNPHGPPTKAGELKLWDLAAGKEKLSLSVPHGFVRCVSFSPDGKTLATGHHDGTAGLWDVATLLSAAAAGSARAEE